MGHTRGTWSRLDRPAIHALYAAASEDRVDRVLVATLVRRLANSAVVRPCRAISAPLGAGVTSSSRETFIDCFADGLPWRGRVGRPRAATLDAWTPATRIEETRFYQDWMEPEGLAPVWPLVWDIASVRAGSGGFVVFAAPGRRSISAADVRAAETIGHHLSRVLRIRDQIRAAEREGTARRELLDRLPLGIAVADERAGTTLQSRGFQRVGDSEAGIHVSDDGRLQCVRSGDEMLLRGLLTQAASGRDGVMSIRRRDEPPQAVFVAGLTAVHSRGAGGTTRQKRVAVFVTDADPAAAAAVAAMRALYDLTSAEAELAALIAGGASLAEAAAARGVGRNTAKAQLAAVFRKTGARRQGDLVRIVRRVPGGLLQ